MTWVAVAVGGAAVIGAGASYAGASKQAKGAEKAGQINLDMFNTLNRQQQPFIQSGYGAAGRLNTLLGLNPRQMPQSNVVPFPGNGGYRPTPGGGVQPIMQTGGGPTMQAGGPGGSRVETPGGGQNMRLAQILQLRAAHGDTRAASMLQRMSA